MTELPPDPPDDDGDLDAAAHADLVRGLLADEPIPVDADVRDRAIAVALAAAHEPPLLVDPSAPREPRRHELDRELPAPTPVTQLDERRPGRFRGLAIAAALVLVVGGAAAINWGQVFGSSSNSESAEDASTAAADANAGAAAGGAADSAEAPVASTTMVPGSDEALASGAAQQLPELGSFDDLAALMDAAHALGATDQTKRTEASATEAAPSTGPCPEVLSSLQVQTLASATFRGAAVLVVQGTDPTGRTRTLVLGSPSCDLLAQE